MSQSQTVVLQLYRNILKAAKDFPSIKRDKIIQEIRADFRANKGLQDSVKVQQRLAIAERGLSDLKAYQGATRADQFEIHLKGATH